MTLAYRKGALNEIYPLNWRPNFVPQATITLFWDCEVPNFILKFTTDILAGMRRRAIEFIDC
jgi:hypothetical protein